MSRSFYDKYYKDQPSVAKGIINVAVVGAVAYIGWEWYRNYKKQREEGEANQAADLATQELQQLATQGIKPNYSNSQFEAFAQTLVQAMTGCGTDEDQIFSVFRSMRNDADVRKLIAVFGIRYYQPCAWTSPVSYAIWQVNDQAYGGGLPTWLGYDLSSGDIEEINRILQANGVNYNF